MIEDEGCGVAETKLYFKSFVEFIAFQVFFSITFLFFFRFEEERCFYFYEDGKRVMIRTPPNPPQINHFQTSAQIYASPNEHPQAQDA